MHELFALTIIIGSCFQVKNDSVAINMVGFSGYAQGHYFNGRILPGAVDTQTTTHDGLTQLSARYMLEGVDSLGDSCRIFIDNRVDNSTPRGCTRPTIVTDSKHLSTIAKGELIGRMAAEGNNLVIRIFKDE